MELNITSILIMILFSFSIARLITATDPDILSDFVVPQGHTPGDLNGSFFTFTGFRIVPSSNSPGQTGATVTKATMVEFPALEGLGVSYAVLRFPPGGVNPPHTHPRGTELLLVLAGILEVGFMDTTGKLFNQTVEVGDVFVFPKGLVHFQINRDTSYESVAISAFGSANPGTVSLPSKLFQSGISDDILVKSFKTDARNIKALRSGLSTSSR